MRPLVPSDHEAAHALWSETEGIGLSSADSPRAIEAFLQRNPGTSFVAEHAGRVAGAVLCGHDGRRGYLYHLAVRAEYRRRGLGRELVARSLAALRERGIEKCHLFAFGGNEAGRVFWLSNAWVERTELTMFSAPTRRG